MTKQQLREAIRKIIKQELNEAPLPSIADPDTEEDVEVDPLISPDEDEDDIIIKKPYVKPKPQAEKKLAQKIAARFISLNEKKSK